MLNGNVFQLKRVTITTMSDNGAIVYSVKLRRFVAQGHKRNVNVTGRGFDFHSRKCNI